MYTLYLISIFNNDFQCIIESIWGGLGWRGSKPKSRVDLYTHLPDKSSYPVRTLMDSYLGNLGNEEAQALGFGVPPPTVQEPGAARQLRPRHVHWGGRREDGGGWARVSGDGGRGALEDGEAAREEFKNEKVWNITKIINWKRVYII